MHTEVYLGAHRQVRVHTAKKANAALLNSRVLISLSPVSEGTSWLAEALLCFSSEDIKRWKTMNPEQQLHLLLPPAPGIFPQG